MAVDVKFLAEAYFAYDEPVPYRLKSGDTIKVVPVNVKQSNIFNSSVDIIAFDKNSVNDPKIISMSYLEFVLGLASQDRMYLYKLVNIIKLCLNIDYPTIETTELGKPLIVNAETGIKITHKDFEDIRRIILYQNLLHYDDEYINPDLKKAMQETDALRNRNIDMPTFERKCAIITAHCGVSKKEQMDMSMRAHALLFEEVCGEIEFTTVRPIAIYAGKGGEIDHWIYRKKKGKFDGYITSKDELVKQMGGQSNFVDTSTDTSRGDALEKTYMGGL